jgi:hypothetical protein
MSQCMPKGSYRARNFKVMPYLTINLTHSQRSHLWATRNNPAISRVQKAFAMTLIKNEEIHLLEIEKAARLSEYVGLMRRFTEDGDRDAKEHAQQILHAIKKIDAQISELMKG